ncbi:MAG: glutamate carboxypeptidase [Burkholderiaceae bacterium]
MTAIVAAAGASPARAERDDALLAAARDEQPAVLAALREMVLIESGSQDVEGLHRMADLVAGRLQALGFTIERRPASPGVGADIVVATLKGQGRRKLMMQAHMDTVYPRGTLASQPYRVDGDRVYGPGIADDKGGIAVILGALHVLLAGGWRDFDTLTVLVNPDEETGSRGSGDLIAETAERHDAVLSFEPTAARSVAKVEAVLLGTAGIAKATLTVKGRAAHAGAAPQLGRNALYELSYQMLQTRDIAHDIPGAQLNWTVARADGPLNQIPAVARAEADIRITVPGADERLAEALREKVASGKLIDDTESTIDIEVGRPPFVAGERGRALAERAQAIYREIDRDLMLVPMTGGGTDAAFAARSGKPVVLESFGLAGFGFHARDEYIEIDSIVPRLYLAARLLTELGRQ